MKYLKTHELSETSIALFQATIATMLKIRNGIAIIVYNPGGRCLEIKFVSSLKTFTNRSHPCLKRTSHEGIKDGGATKTLHPGSLKNLFLA